MTGFPTDENGPYYWHVKSGNIQREPPEAPPHSKRESRRSLIKDNDSVSENFGIETRRMDFDALRHFHDSMMQINNFHTLSGMVNTVTRSNTSSALDQELENKRKVELALKWDTLSIYLIVSNFSSMQRFTLCFFYFFFFFQAKKLSRTSGLRGQGQTYQIRRTFPRVDRNRGGRFDAWKKQQGRQQMYRRLVLRKKRPSGCGWAMGRCWYRSSESDSDARWKGLLIGTIAWNFSGEGLVHGSGRRRVEANRPGESYRAQHATDSHGEGVGRWQRPLPVSES